MEPDVTVGLTVMWLRGNGRSQRIAPALAAGARAAGYNVTVKDEGSYSTPDSEIVAFYGYIKTLPRIMDEYIEAGRKVVFVDLGYWGRRHGGRFKGFHKISVNARHPTEYLMARDRNVSRLRRFGVVVQPWRTRGDHIVLAGMSKKSAESYGFEAEEWERNAVAELRRHTDRPIIYRPKPSWLEATHISATTMQRTPLPDQALVNCHAVVTHHSNVAVDALAAGVPTFCMDGVAAPMSLQKLRKIENPLFPQGREQWLANIAWAQWNVDEMESGVMWRYLKSEGLIP